MERTQVLWFPTLLTLLEKFDIPFTTVMDRHRKQMSCEHVRSPKKLSPIPSSLRRSKKKGGYETEMTSTVDQYRQM